MRGNAQGRLARRASAWALRSGPARPTCTEQYQMVHDVVLVRKRAPTRLFPEHYVMRGPKPCPGCRKGLASGGRLP